MDRNYHKVTQNMLYEAPDRPVCPNIHKFMWTDWCMGAHTCTSTYILRVHSEIDKIPELECHLVAKPNGGFWVDDILLHHIPSTFCVHSHTEISASKVCHFTGNVWKVVKFSCFFSKINVLFEPELPTGGSICHNMTQYDLFSAYE